MGLEKFGVEARGYAAGFFDAEGCVLISRERERIYRLRVAITSTDRGVLEWFSSKFGGWVTNQPDNRPNKRKRWCWVAWSSTAAEFLRFVLPDLIIKREQVDLALAFWKRVGKAIRLSGDEIVVRESFKERISSLKAKVDLGSVAHVSPSYAAGFFDGEGSVSIGEVLPGYYALQIRISNTVRCVLEGFVATFGGRVCVKDSTRNRDKYVRKIAWTWYVNSDASVAFLREILPHLIVKKNQAVLGISYALEKKPMTGEALRRFGEDCRAKMMSMNLGKVETIPAGP